MNPSLRKWLIRLLWLAVLGVLLFWALRNAPLAEIWGAVRRLQFWQLAVILALNLLLYVLITLRWWLIVRAESRRVPYLPLLGVRAAVFGVSYFTLGPQVGGEPLQVMALQRKYGITYTRAAASVLLDKLLEFLVNFLALGFGLTAVFQAGILAGSGPQLGWSLAGLGLLVLIPPIHLLLLYNRRHPVTVLLRALPFVPQKAKAVRFLCAAEWMAGTFCQRHPRALIGALGASLLAAMGMVADYALMVAFLGIPLPFWRVVAGWTAGWLAFLMPLPGGLGALEASQVLALGMFGIPAAAALAVTLLMRGRDLLVGGLGLLLAGRGFSPARRTHEQVQ